VRCLHLSLLIVHYTQDARRCAHRLALLANSGITQAYSMTMRSNSKVREILQVSTPYAVKFPLFNCLKLWYYVLFIVGPYVGA
jgi:hypothetical protein